MKILRDKHNLTISSSVSSGQPDKYSYETPHKQLSG